jgi:hypothetical protein
MDTQNIPELVYNVIKYGILLALSIGFAVLFVTSALVRDTYWIEKNPMIFGKELLIMSFLTALPILYISYHRGGELKDTAVEFGLLFVKIALLHVTFQLSGVYSVLFPQSGNPELKAL